MVNLPSERGAVGRVYDDVKNRILAGEIRLRERLDVDHLARTYRVSGTPVRQALSHLAFERLIIPHPTRGFHVALWTEKGLRELYEWRGMLACLAAETHDRLAPARMPNDAQVYPDAVTALLQRLNTNSNAELVRTATNADERLRAARLVEPELMPGCECELADLSNAIANGTLPQLKTVLRIYHQQRADRADEIRARALLRALPDEDE
jgi:DNA-binding GntR family transcriptional regulator